MKTKVIEFHPEHPDFDDIAKCAQVIRQGGLVVFPTETVYGIAADYSNEKAMKRLREVKKRSADKPFSILVSQRGLISNYSSSQDTGLFKLIDRFWPGPLTIVVPGKEKDKTIGVRMPDNIIALKLVQEAQCAIAAPSANIEGDEPPSSCQDALKALDGLVDIAIDGGTSKIGKGSSVVDLTGGEPSMIREGVISLEEIKKTINKKTILFVCTGNSCRSVMAEYLLKSLIKGRDDVEIVSAGTGVFVQSTASADTIAVLQEEGIDAREHVSQSIGTILLKKSDLIFVMTLNHRQQVLERVPSIEKRVYLLREFAATSAAGAVTDIPDPMGHSYHDYKECVSIIKESVHKLVELI